MSFHKLDERDFQDYAAFDGAACPFCQAEQAEPVDRPTQSYRGEPARISFPEKEGPLVQWQFRCKVCKRVWWEVYVLEAVLYIPVEV